MRSLSLAMTSIMFLSLFGLYVMRATPDRVAACETATGWDAARCAYEINR